MTNRILIIGGYGVFGGRLAMALASDPMLDVIVAGRSLKKAEAFCRLYGGQPASIDLSSPDLAAQIKALSPSIIIDAAGPFQAYGEQPYRVAEAAIACGAHYLDLSDDGAFTTGISALNGSALTAGVSVLSGVSSVPAMSGAAVTDLAGGFADIHLIESAILPGNKAPRGKSVIRSILAQTGQPLRLWRGNRWIEAKGWSARKTLALTVPGAAPIKGRWASLIGAPDLTLFPARFQARSVVFRAGLDLKLMHGGLSLLSKLVSAGWMPRLTRLTGILATAARLLQPFGSDRGGMLVRVNGLMDDGSAHERNWTLIAEAGDGPHIPAVPARIMVGKLLSRAVQPGARACIDEFTLAEAETALSALRVVTDRRDAPLPRLFEAALGDGFSQMPTSLQDLHTVLDQRVWCGEASITRGAGALSHMAGWLAGFPKAGSSVPVTVTQTRTAAGEDWVREFGTGRFVSHLRRKASAPAGQIEERFGLMRFAIQLKWDGEALHYPVVRGRVLGIPLPNFLLPKSETKETSGPDGRTHFNVAISLPLAGPIVHYQGWLTSHSDSKNGTSSGSSNGTS